MCVTIILQAKLVASATSNLCEAANGVVQGQAQEEKLIAAAKNVAASTAQLLIACQVKADAHSENNKRLQVISGCDFVMYNRGVDFSLSSPLLSP